MTFAFSLVDQVWLPCVTFDGKVDELSLPNALVQAHRYRELGGESPLVTASLYRLLLAIMHRVFGPKDRDTWNKLWVQGHVTAKPVEDYLSQWRHRFDLFDAVHPFCQGFHDTIPVNPVGNLLHELSKNDTFYDHRTEEGVTLTPAEAARHLLTAQAFGRWMTKGPYGQLPFGTCARGIVFFARGENLFEDLVLNLVRYPTRDDVVPHSDADAPCWEMADPFEPERQVPLGYLDYLTWLSRRILLLPKEIDGQVFVAEAKIAPGLRMSDALRNPAMQHKNMLKRGWKSWVPFTEDRALWRDSATILQVAPPSASGGERDSYPPVVLEWLASLVSEGDALQGAQTKRLTGMGMAGDLNQYRVHFYRREDFPLPLSYLQDAMLVQSLQQAIGLAEASGRQLWGALSSLATEFLFHKKPQGLSQPERQQRDDMLGTWGAERLYWSGLELPFYSLITDLPGETQLARRAWASAVQRTAWRSLDGAIATMGTEPAALRAAVLARQRLGAGLHKVSDGWPAPQQQESNHVSRT